MVTGTELIFHVQAVPVTMKYYMHKNVLVLSDYSPETNRLHIYGKNRNSLCKRTRCEFVVTELVVSGTQCSQYMCSVCSVYVVGYDRNRLLHRVSTWTVNWCRVL